MNDDPQLVALRAEIAARPGDARLHFRLGELLLARGDGDAALEALSRAAELAPHVAAAHFGLANAQYALGRFEAAVVAYRTARAIENDAPTANNLGNALAQLGKFDEAAQVLADAVALDADFLPARINLGRALLALRRFAEAVAQLETVVDRAPDAYPALLLLGEALAGLGKLGAAAARCAQAVALRPDEAAPFATLGGINLRRGLLTESLFTYAKALQAAPHDAEIHAALIYAWQHDPEASAERLAEEARHYGDRFQSMLEPPPQSTSGAAARKLTIGYLSPDIHRGAAARLLERVFAHHDREAYRCVGYATTGAGGESVLAMAAAADAWHDVAALGPLELAERIRSDAVDVLVDLAGHRRANRLPAVALRPASVQISWLGSPGTTGVQAMNYLIADGTLVPAGEEALLREEVVRLDGGYACFAEPRRDVEAGPPPSANGAPFTFGAFVDLGKITPSVVGLWGALLEADPRFRLFLKTPALGDADVRAQTAERFAELNVDPARIRLAGGDGGDDSLDAYREVDVALDTFPFDGGLATLDALWMGVPVVHRRGSRFAGRRGEAWLQRVGLGDCLVNSGVEYLERAQAWAADHEGLALTRRELRTRLRAAGLCDVTALVRRLETAYQAMWRKA